MVKPLALRGIRSGAGGSVGTSASSRPSDSSLAYWLGMVRERTVSSRSRQKSPVSVTRVKSTGV